jgi:glycine cleavage system H lipoate-binding protein
MAIVRNFLGNDIDVPEDRLYSPAAHFWFRRVGDAEPGATEYEVGVTEPGVALTGGLVELDVLADPGAAIVPSEEVAFATTRKAIKYFMSPVGGTVTVANVATTAGDSGATPDCGATAASVNEAPYDVWLFRMTLAAGDDATLVDGATYAAKLAASEHATDAAAAGAAAAKAGKISPTCKSIYSGIKQ